MTGNPNNTRSQRTKVGINPGPPISSSLLSTPSSPQPQHSSPQDPREPLPHSPPLNPLVVEPPPAAQKILELLPGDSVLAIILKEPAYFHLHKPGTPPFKEFSTKLHELTLMNMIDQLIESVPQTVICLYTHLTVAAVYDRLNRDIPFEMRYTALPGGDPYPYNKQAEAYGLDKLLDAYCTLKKGRLPLLNHPKCKSNTYLAIQSQLNLKDHHMAKLFLGTLLQTFLRNCDYLSEQKVKKGPRNQTYAAIAQQRLPLQN